MSVKSREEVSPKIDVQIDVELEKLRGISDTLNEIIALMEGKRDKVDDAITALEAARKVRIPPKI